MDTIVPLAHNFIIYFLSTSFILSKGTGMNEGGVVPELQSHWAFQLEIGIDDRHVVCVGYRLGGRKDQARGPSASGARRTWSPSAGRELAWYSKLQGLFTRVTPMSACTTKTFCRCAKRLRYSQSEMRNDFLTAVGESDVSTESCGNKVIADSVGPVSSMDV